jgi:hypothetical protein
MYGAQRWEPSVILHCEHPARMQREFDTLKNLGCTQSRKQVVV